MKQFSLAQLFSTLIGAGARRASVLGEDSSMSGAATTIRLSPEARRFFEAQAEAFGGASLSAVIAMTLEGVMRATKGEVDAPAERDRRTVDSIRDRFAHVHQAHDVDLTTMVELLRPHGFSLGALRDESQLLNLLTAAVVEETASRFHVRREWLLGRGPSTEAEGHWYKAPHNLCARVNELAAAGLRPEVLCVRREQSDFERAFTRGDDAPEEPVGFVIQCQMHPSKNGGFATYERWEFQRWNYQKCRLYYKSVIRWLEKAGTKRLITEARTQCQAEII